jgi:hypothetical protein
MLESNNSELLIDYATNALKKRWPEAEEKLVEWLHIDSLTGYYDKVTALMEYAVRYGLQNWPAFEADMLNNSYVRKSEILALYALNVLQDRWEFAEPFIQTDSRIWKQYISRFPEALGVEFADDITEYEEWSKYFKEKGPGAFNKLDPEQQITPGLMQAYITSIPSATYLFSNPVLDAAARDPVIANVVYKGLVMHGATITPEDFQKRLATRTYTQISNTENT